jgi:hypothetical protein
MKSTRRLTVKNNFVVRRLCLVVDIPGVPSHFQGGDGLVRRMATRSHLG